MGSIDPQRERQRLAQVYASQSDGELEQAAAQAEQLTDIAREALWTEMSKRNLKPPDRESEGYELKPGFRDLVTVRSFWSLPEANLAKGILENAGIESFLFDENIVGLGLYINAVRGVTLRVDREFAEEADQILVESISAQEQSDEF